MKTLIIGGKEWRYELDEQHDRVRIISPQNRTLVRTVSELTSTPPTLLEKQRKEGSFELTDRMVRNFISAVCT